MFHLSSFGCRNCGLGTTDGELASADEAPVFFFSFCERSCRSGIGNCKLSIEVPAIRVAVMGTANVELPLLFCVDLIIYGYRSVRNCQSQLRVFNNFTDLCIRDVF